MFVQNLKKAMRIWIVAILVGLLSCDAASDSTEMNDSKPSELDILMNKMYNSHGKLGDFRFKFRDVQYSFKFTDSDFIYTKYDTINGATILDSLDNAGFRRYENGRQLQLNQDEKDKYAESLNSVVYFACLPLKLQDPAVNLTYVDSVVIKNIDYHVIQVDFNKEGGGKDHEDIFYYWVNSENFQVDYLAYRYNTNGGGVRFRSAFNSRMINGMRFQDYKNYGAPIGTPLDSLALMFERHELELLSEIISADVKPLNN